MSHAPQSPGPLQSLDEWEDFVVARYPEEGVTANKLDKDFASLVERFQATMKAVNEWTLEGLDARKMLEERLAALSGQLHDIEEQLNTGSGFDASRVESIKAAIRAGEFKVNPSKVADKLLATVRELVGK